MKLLTILLLLGTIQLSASSGSVTDNDQQKTVTGRIVDPTGNPLPGVNIIEKGTTNGVISTTDGGFSINVASANSTLSFSFIGYLTQEILVGTQTNISVTLTEAVSYLSEIVVVGYGTRLREELTGSVSTVSSEQMLVSTAPTAIGRIQGAVSGVTITDGNAPGAGATVLVRGLGTINNASPLYVIDGIPSGPGSSINPNDIESVSVLKDASSTAIYGSRGANGVILITTKRGHMGAKPRLTLSARTGMTNATNQYDLLNTKEYGELLWLQAANRGIAPTNPLYGTGATPVIPDYILPAAAAEGSAAVDPALYKYPGYTIIKANKEGTDWYDEIYTTGVIQEYNLAITGGGQNSSYAFSAGYLNEQGFIIHSGFERYSVRINSDARVFDWLNIGQSLSVSHTIGKGNRGDNGEGTVISQAYRSQPIIPVYDIMGNFAGSKAPSLGNSANPVAVQVRSQHNKSLSYRLLGNLFAEARILPGLNFKSLFGFDLGPSFNYSFSYANPEHSEPQALDSHTSSADTGLGWNWSNQLNYDKTFGIHRVLAVAGIEAISSWGRDFSGTASQYFSQDPLYMTLSTGESNYIVSGGASETSLFSMFGRVNYDLKSRYLFELTVRRDGSSRFSKANRWGTFPAASAAWVISEEDFFAGLGGSWLNFAKLRLGWGLSGNDRIGEYQTYTTYGIHSSASAYSINGGNNTRVQGFQPSRFGNEDITWETTETYNGGLDFQFLNNSLSFTVDIWQRNTTDMLYRIQQPVVTGVATYPVINIGEMKNVGFDIELGYRNNALGGDLTYNITGTLSHYKNEIVKLGNDLNETVETASLRQFNYARFSVGSSYPEFFGYIVDGIFQTQPEVDAYPKAFGTAGTYNQVGHFKYRDTNGDGVIAAADRVYIGNPHPKLTYGLNLDLGYSGFDLNMSFYGVYGNKIMNYVRRWIDYSQFLGNRSKARLYESWGSPYLASNADATLAKADLDTGSEQPSTHFLEDGSFFRLKSLQLGYSLPKTVSSRIGVQGLRVYAQATNLLTITKYSGLDPEYNASGTTIGIDQGAWPTARQVMFGITLSL